MRLRPIVPKKPVMRVADIDRKVHRDLRDFGVEFQRQMESYPPARPWKRPPKRGLRRGGRRTGTLKRGWATGLRLARFKTTVENPVGYSIYVQGNVPGAGKGRRQTAVARERGWQNVTEMAKRTWAKYRGRIQKSLAGR